MRKAVATYAALTALITATGLVDDGVYATAARATDEDGGGGLWRFDAASTATSNGGTVLAIDGGGAGRFFRLYNPDEPVNAQWFGFKVGGGNGDAAANTTALQAALDAAYWVAMPTGSASVNAVTHTVSNRLTGAGKDKTILTLGNTQNTRMFTAASKTLMVYEDFTINMNFANNVGSGAHDGIRLETCTAPLVRNVRVTGAQGTFSGSPVGGGVSVDAGSGIQFHNYSADACYDGYQLTSHTDGRDYGSSLTTCLRNGGTVGSGCHRFEHHHVYAVGNSTTYAGAGLELVSADDPKGYGGYFASNTLGHGLQHNTCARAEQHGGKYLSNGISGLDFFTSVDAKVFGGYSASNTVRGIEIDTTSDRAVVHGFTAVSNVEKQISVFRSADVTLIGCEGDVDGWDGGGATGLVARLTIIGGHQADTLTLESGACANVRLVNAKFSTITDTGAHIVHAVGCSGQTDFTAALDVRGPLTATRAGLPVSSLNNTNSASSQVLVLEGDRSAPAANDAIYVSYKLSDASGNQDEFARVTMLGTTVTNGAETAQFRWSVMSAGALTDQIFLQAGLLAPVTNDAIQLGAGTLAYADLFLGSGAVTNYNNGNYTVTHSANLLTYSGAAAYGVQDLNGAGAVNVTTLITKWGTTAADAGTLADGAQGQIKIITMDADGGDGTLTPTNLGNGTTITFNDVGDTVLLVFLNADWWIVSNTGCVVA